MSKFQHTVGCSKKFCKFFGQRFYTKGNKIKTNQDRPPMGNKANLNKFHIEINQCVVLCGHSEVKLEISNRKIPGKSQNIWRLNNIHKFTGVKKS